MLGSAIEGFGQKSRSATSWPILTSLGHLGVAVGLNLSILSSNTLASFSMVSRFQAAIYVGAIRGWSPTQPPSGGPPRVRGVGIVACTRWHYTP
jgi:hypothetical protein